MGFILILLAIAGIGLLVASSIDTHMENKVGKEEWERIQADAAIKRDSQKYNDYKLTCPTCHSNKVKKIGEMHRAASVAVWGIASDKLFAQFECDDCGYKW